MPATSVNRTSCTADVRRPTLPPFRATRMASRSREPQQFCDGSHSESPAPPPCPQGNIPIGEDPFRMISTLMTAAAFLRASIQQAQQLGRRNGARAKSRNCPNRPPDMPAAHGCPAMVAHGGTIGSGSSGQGSSCDCHGSKTADGKRRQPIASGK